MDNSHLYLSSDCFASETTLPISRTPLAGQADAFPRTAAYCPSWYYKDGAYCIAQQREDNNDVVPMPKGVSYCPSGYYKDGAYCRELNARRSKANNN